MPPFVFSSMGTVVSLRCAEPALTRQETDAVTAVFAEMDRRFSLYAPDSELSRIADASLRLGDASDELRTAYAEALDWRSRTGGAFTPHRPDGVIDLSGIVKAIAMQRAAEVLRTAGRTGWCLNVGGDILTDGRDTHGPWMVGIVDPAARLRLAGRVVVDPARPAVATSGSAERGDHIWPFGIRSDDTFVQVTVAAGDIVTADVLATAIMSAGPAGLDDLTDRFAVDVLTVDSAGRLMATPGMRHALGVRPITPESAVRALLVTR